MKRMFAVLALASGLATTAQAADYVSTVAATDPIANFHLDSTDQGSTVGGYTTSWTASTGVGPGTPIVADPGNTAATFTGINDVSGRSEINTSLSGGLPGMGSLNLWINLAQLPSLLGHTEYLAGESQVGNDFDLQIDGDNELRFYTGGGENTGVMLDASALNTWLMVTATFDGTLGASGYRTIYINGVQVAHDVGFVNGAAKGNPFTIGYSDVFGNRDFDGSIDEVSVWDHALTGNQVAAIYAARLNPADAPGSVPEPASWAMFLGGFGLIGGTIRRRHVAISLA